LKNDDDKGKISIHASNSAGLKLQERIVVHIRIFAPSQDISIQDNVIFQIENKPTLAFYDPPPAAPTIFSPI
jgi:hypothetical protein